MYLVVIAWLYVTVLMAVAEASSPTGSVLGAVLTFVLYGLLPLSILVYILGTPGRKRRMHAAHEMQERAAEMESAAVAPPRDSASADPDAGGHAPGAPGASTGQPVREET
jgi:hypothetical protein